MRLLIIEDQASYAEALRELLSNYVSTMTTTGFLSDALHYAERDEWDVIILDLTLADSGADHTCESIRKIKAMQPGSSLIVVTGHPDPAWRDRCISNGADEFVNKIDATAPKRNALLLATLTTLQHKPTDRRSPSFMRHVEMLEKAVKTPKPESET